MPVHTTRTLPSNRWTAITEGEVGAITFQNTGRTALRVAVTDGPAPETLTGSLLYAPGQGERHRVLPELAPGAIAPTTLYACPVALGGGELFVSYGAPIETDASTGEDDSADADAGAVAGLLDQFPGAAAAYSLRALSTNTEAVVRVRRGSDDTEADFTAEALVDGTLTDWAGTGDAFVVTWYDQSGNGWHVSQTQPGEQPKIVEAGTPVELNGKPAIAFDGTTEGLSDPEAMIALSTRDFTYYAVAGYEAVPSWAGHAFGSLETSEGLIPGYIHESDNVRIGIDGLYAAPEPGVSVLDGNQRLIVLEGDRDGDARWTIDGSEYRVDISTRAASMIVLKGLGVFHTLGSGGRYLKGKAQEIVFYANDQSANRESLTEAVNAHYLGASAEASETTEDNQAIDPALALAIENDDVGAAVVGGYYVGIIDTTQQNIEPNDAYQEGLRYALIASPGEYEANSGISAAEGLPNEKLAWDTQAGPAESACLTRWDGLSATEAILARNDERFEAFQFIATLRDQYPAPATPGGSDWYIGALDEMALVYRRLKPTDLDNVVGPAGIGNATFPEPFETGENPSSAPVGLAYSNDPLEPARTDVLFFRKGGAQAIDGWIYQTSTDGGANGSAWTQWFDRSYAGRTVELGKDIARNVRPIRRVVLPPAA